jgi:adenosylcobinamide-GDP ribazoletransferase
VALNDLGHAFRGGVAFCTRLPFSGSERDWLRFQEIPAAFPAVGYLVGLLLAIPFVLLDGPAAAVAAVYLLFVYLLTGVNHLDGVADLGDAAAIHDGDDRRKALKDTTTGVGAVGAVAVTVAALALGTVSVAGLPVGAVFLVAVVLAAEVSAKLAMATVACLGTAAHEGLGSQFTRNADPALLLGPAVVSVPAALFGGVPTVLAVAAGPLVAYGLVRWAETALGGVNGDVFGAANELGRVAALLVGVIAWTQF